MSEGVDSQPVALGACRVELRVSCWSLPERENATNPDPWLVVQLLSDGQWSEIVSQTKVTKNLVLTNEEIAENSTITIEAEEVSRTNEFVQLQFHGEELDDKDFFSKSDPFLEIYKITANETEHLVWRTEVVKNNLSPRWEPFRVSMQSLCSCDPDKTIRCVIYDHDSSGKHDYIGEFSTNFQQMLQASTGDEVKWECINHKYQEKKKHYKNSGYIVLTQCKMEKVHTFLDYIMGGLQISFTEPNEYLKALSSVGEICQDYDSDKRFPAFGFGARIPPDFEVSTQVVLEIRLTETDRCLTTSLSTSTLRIQNAKKYRVLLVLTDGVVSDMPEACDAVVRASRLPLSIIIVGIGNADFSDMRELNGDRGMLESDEGRAVRDIVQFVPAPPNALAKYVLAEVPKQVVEYYASKGIAPGTQRSSSPQPQ
ncbi:hypothetical protein JD844_000960 [Phrynosoma platyrhinos]|uniref:C2 domain-containing protein n=1 Tax=Phrynosoma platyrhinos TaxID=52577 RepID=A0ABQ7T8V0_PHRPL|nr:hypothetical protein JD844_000960 [Phrynosoma platyrhinos]